MRRTPVKTPRNRRMVFKARARARPKTNCREMFPATQIRVTANESQKNSALQSLAKFCSPTNSQEFRVRLTLMKAMARLYRAGNRTASPRTARSGAAKK